MTAKTFLTLEEFWALPEGETAYELVDGEAIPKVLPKYFKSCLQGTLLRLVAAWCLELGRIRLEWWVVLQRNGEPWVPAPDLSYVSYERLPKIWRRNEACPVPPELVIEIISPGQTLNEFEEKAEDYFAAGVSRVWVVDPEAISIRAFYPDGKITLYTGDMLIVDALLPGLELTTRQIFESAELMRARSLKKELTYYMSAPELEKLHSILKISTNPRQRAMVENLIKKVNEQQAKPSEADTPNADISNADTTESQPQTAEVLAATSPEVEPKPTAEFKAVGIIQGEVNVNKDSIYSITIGGKTYRLKIALTKQQVLWALRAEIKNTESSVQRIIVYPRMTHFPVRDQPPALHFELVGFQGRAVQDKGIINDLKDFEFKLSGLWQFIPVCRTPCCSIFKNFSEQRKLFVKSAEPFVRVRFMKASHIPLSWRDSPVKPFRFNPKLPKEQAQGRPMFVQVKARFIPGRDQFEFVEQLAEPLAESPRFLKASKSDKDAQRLNAPPKPPKPESQQSVSQQPKPKPKITRPIKNESSAR